MLPDHVNPVLFLTALGFAILFTGGGLLTAYFTLRVRRAGLPARFRVIDFEIHADREGTSYSPVYEVLDGPRAGETVYSAMFGSRSKVTVLNAAIDAKAHDKLKAKIGEERKGWVDEKSNTGVTMKDMLGGLIFAGLALIVGFGAAIVVVNAWLG